jgi:hypothetical protein
MIAPLLRREAVMAGLWNFLYDPLKQTAWAISKTGLGQVALGITENSISDARFWDQLQQIRRLKQFFFQENVAFKPDDLAAIGLGVLDRITFHPYGREPKAEEWMLLDEKQSVLTTYLDDKLKWKFRLRNMRAYFTVIPVVFLVCAITALFIGTGIDIYNDKMEGHLHNIVYVLSVVLWTIALGGLGACAFLGTTMISEYARMNMALRTTAPGPAAQDGDFDLTARDLIWTRIVVGILFAFLLGVPLSAGSLNYMVVQIRIGDIGSTSFDTKMLETIGMTLLPFAVGFSTTLVLAIMDRLLSTLRTGLGISAK